MPSYRHRLGLLALGTLLLVAGCGGTDAPDDAAGGAPAKAGDTTAATGPDAVLNEMLAIEPKVRDVINRLAEACVRAQGITELPPREPQTAGRGAPAVQFSPTAAEAAEHGYGIADSSDDPADTKKSFTFSSDSAERRYLKALVGQAGAVPSDEADADAGGCYEESRKKVYGQDTAPKNPVTGIGAAAQAAYADDAEVKAKLTVWAGCLRKAGYPALTDPEDAARYAQYFRYPVGQRPGGPVPDGGPWPLKTARAKEIALATADAACADSSGLRTVQKQAWAKALSAALADHSAELFGYRDAMNAALERGQHELQG